MSNNRYNTEAISLKLRQANVLLAQGKTINQVCAHLDVTEQMYHRWQKSCGEAYGAIKPDQAGRLRELEAENARLEYAVAILTVDNLILKEVAEDNR